MLKSLLCATGFMLATLCGTVYTVSVSDPKNLAAWMAIAAALFGGLLFLLRIAWKAAADRVSVGHEIAAMTRNLDAAMKGLEAVELRIAKTLDAHSVKLDSHTKRLMELGSLSAENRVRLNRIEADLQNVLKQVHERPRRQP